MCLSGQVYGRGHASLLQLSIGRRREGSCVVLQRTGVARSTGGHGECEAQRKACAGCVCCTALLFACEWRQREGDSTRQGTIGSCQLSVRPPTVLGTVVPRHSTQQRRVGAQQRRDAGTGAARASLRVSPFVRNAERSCEGMARCFALLLLFAWVAISPRPDHRPITYISYATWPEMCTELVHEAGELSAQRREQSPRSRTDRSILHGLRPRRSVRGSSGRDGTRHLASRIGRTAAQPRESCRRSDRKGDVALSIDSLLLPCSLLRSAVDVARGCRCSVLLRRSPRRSLQPGRLGVRRLFQP